MRSSTRNVGGGFAAGLIMALTIGSMLGLKQPDSPRPINPRIEALRNQVLEAEDQLAAAKTLVAFWQQEMTAEDAEVLRLETGQQANGSAPFFCDRAKGLSNRAGNSFLDARLQEAMCARKVQALSVTAVGP